MIDDVKKRRPETAKQPASSPGTSTLRLWKLLVKRTGHQIAASLSRNLLISLIAVLVILAAIILPLALVGQSAHSKTNTSPVPLAIKNAVDFPIYYPDQAKLPAGYTLDKNSFAAPVSNGISYSVNYSSGKLVFSLQPKLSDQQLATFVANYIPLNNQLQTPLGTAKLGAYTNHGKLETLVSLPTSSNTWLIITGPANVDQNKLQQVLNALVKN